ncbi:MAG: hypothetical protein WC700_08840 [Gemmatimonadaceae bacterium]
MSSSVARESPCFRVGIWLLALAASACDGHTFPKEMVEQIQFGSKVVALPQKMPVVECHPERPEQPPQWPLQVLAIDTRACPNCARELTQSALMDTVFATLVVVTPDSAASLNACRWFGVRQTHVVASEHWTYDRQSGVVRWYEKISPNSVEFIGGYATVRAAVEAVRRARRAPHRSSQAAAATADPP